jgi:hypothetical protein
VVTIAAAAVVATTGIINLINRYIFVIKSFLVFQEGFFIYGRVIPIVLKGLTFTFKRNKTFAQCHAKTCIAENSFAPLPWPLPA